MHELTTASSPGTVEIPAPVGQIEVSVVIVTYGSGELVLDAIRSVVDHTSAPFEVIVVDNPLDGPDQIVDDADLTGDAGPGSSVTATILRERTSGLILITPDRNLGFGGGCDLGARTASGRYLCFVNPDVVLSAGWFDGLRRAFEDPAVAVAAPVLRRPDGTLDEAGQLIDADGNTRAIGGPEVLVGDDDQCFARDVDYASGACLLVLRDEHLGRGGFDPRYHPAYFEDADYGMRVEAEGRVIRLVPDVEVAHHRGSGAPTADATAIAQRSRAAFRERWSAELASRPTRVDDRAGALAARDRRCLVRDVHVLRAGEGVVPADVIRHAEQLAAGSPRDRYTLIVDQSSAVDLAGIDLDAARASGLEVVVTADVAAELADRHGVTNLVQHGTETTHRWETSPTEGAAAVEPPPSEAASPALDDHPRWPVGALLAAFAIGVLVRVLVLVSFDGRLNSDEAYTGLQAFDILDGNLPVVIGGTVYTLPLESYVYAPVAAIGVTGVVSLKMVPIVMWLIASALVGVAAHQIAGRRAAVMGFALAWITPGALLVVSTSAYESYASGMAVTVAVFVIGHRLLDADAPSWRGPMVLGALCGLGTWMHPMYLATLAPIALTVVVVHLRRPQVAAWTVLGGVVGASPFLVWNAINDWPSLRDSPSAGGTWLDRFAGFVEDLLPRAFGLRDGALEWTIPRALAVAAYALLISAVVYGAVAAVRHDHRRSRWLLPIVLVAVLPAMALFSPLVFVLDGRYGIVPFPFIVMAVAVAIDAVTRTIEFGARARVATSARWLVPVVALGVWVVAYLGPQLDATIDSIDGDPNADTEAMVAALDAAGFEYLNGSFWSVHAVAFVSDDRVIGAVTPGWPVRLADRQREVESVPPDQVAYAFQRSDELPAALPLPVESYERIVFGDHVLYLPVAG